MESGDQTQSTPCLISSNDLGGGRKAETCLYDSPKSDLSSSYLKSELPCFIYYKP